MSSLSFRSQVKSLNELADSLLARMTDYHAWTRKELGALKSALIGLFGAFTDLEAILSSGKVDIFEQHAFLVGEVLIWQNRQMAYTWCEKWGLVEGYDYEWIEGEGPLVMSAPLNMTVDQAMDYSAYAFELSQSQLPPEFRLKMELKEGVDQEPNGQARPENYSIEVRLNRAPPPSTICKIPAMGFTNLPYYAGAPEVGEPQWDPALTTSLTKFRYTFPTWDADEYVKWIVPTVTEVGKTETVPTILNPVSMTGNSSVLGLSSYPVLALPLSAVAESGLNLPPPITVPPFELGSGAPLPLPTIVTLAAIRFLRTVMLPKD